MDSAQASFQVSVDGNVATSAIYDSQLAESFILLTFCSINHMHHRLGVCSTTVTVRISSGEYFTCAIKLKVLDRLSHPYNIVLGRDWFNLCSIGLEDNPEAAVPLSSMHEWLIFAASPVNAIHSQISSKFSFF
jgi:hypothetical protein